MKVNTNTVSDILSKLRINFLTDSVARKNGEEPFRSELYSSDQLDRHGKVVAQSHKLQKGLPVDKLLKRLEDNESTLLEVRNLLNQKFEFHDINFFSAEPRNPRFVPTRVILLSLAATL